jgi:hypothetical protein
MENTRTRLPSDRLQITARALKEVEAYACLVAEQFGAACESIGFLLAEPGPPGPATVITDVMLACDQTVSGASAQISPTGVLASGREIERRGKRVVGWWHAHPSQTYHSGTDDENLRLVLEDVSLHNRWLLHEPQTVPVTWEGDALVLRTASETVRITGLQRGASGTGFTQQAELQSHAVMVSAAYSLVVSASRRSEPYAEVAVQTQCALCGRCETQARQVAIEVVDGEREALRQEVRRKVRSL